MKIGSHVKIFSDGFREPTSNLPGYGLRQFARVYEGPASPFLLCS